MGWNIARRAAKEHIKGRISSCAAAWRMIYFMLYQSVASGIALVIA